jgi:hypothetical protein
MPSENSKPADHTTNDLTVGRVEFGPQTERLRARLFDDPDKKLVDMHVSWEPGAEALTPEQRAAVINDMLDQGEAQDRDRIYVRRVEVRAACAALYRLARLGQSDVREILAGPSPVLDLKRQIRAAIDMADALAWQMLPHDEARRLKADLDAEQANGR